MKRDCRRRPAMVAAPAVAPLASPLPAALLCAASLLASARPMQIKLPNLPNLPSLPNMPKLPELKLPELDLPNFGKPKSGAKPVARAPRAVSAPVTVKVRPASGVVPTDAPTLAELQGNQTTDGIPVSEGWKRFPARRMPGANMDGWKQAAKEMTPKA